MSVEREEQGLDWFDSSGYGTREQRQRSRASIDYLKVDALLHAEFRQQLESIYIYRITLSSPALLNWRRLLKSIMILVFQCLPHHEAKKSYRK
jgi:hypothetical protein